MDARQILAALGAERPHVVEALRTARQAQHQPHVMAALNTLTEFSLQAYGDLLQARSDASDLIKEVPTVGTRSYHALKPNATILVKRICAIAGIPFKSIAEDAT